MGTRNATSPSFEDRPEKALERSTCKILYWPTIDLEVDGKARRGKWHMDMLE
jgi:hypothetical protein